VAPTRAAKVLAKIAGLEGWKGAGKAARGKATGVNTLAKVCGGDLRSAINALQLLSGPGGTLTCASPPPPTTPTVRAAELT
jgi:DNA polymerase III delta prime subunit